MPRPGFVLDVDEKTPPVLAIGGTSLRLQRYGIGMHVAYPPEGEPSVDPTSLLMASLSAPLSGEPLIERLRSIERLTIVFGGDAVPSPRMKFDVRRDVTERVLELAARAGVDDVALVAATGIARKLTEADFVAMLGERVVRSFITEGGLSNHDVEDEAGLASIGVVAGHEVRINSRVASSDLVINIVVRADEGLVPMRQVVSGLADVATIDFVNGLEGSRTPSRALAVAELVRAKVPIVTIEVVVGAPTYDAPLSFVGKREWEWNLADQLSWVAVRQLMAKAPKQASSRLFGSLKADYAVLDVVVGDPLEADEQARQVWASANHVDRPDGVDVLARSVWGIGRDSSDPVGSPLAAAHSALVGGLGGLREGGALVAYHPLRDRFSNRHDTAAADFFAGVLTTTLDCDEIFATFQERYTVDPWYLQLYRTQHAFHPLGVFHRWYETQRAREHVGDVIWIGADRRSAAVLGHRAATTWADALEIASNSVGTAPSVLVLR